MEVLEQQDHKAKGNPPSRNPTTKARARASTTASRNPGEQYKPKPDNTGKNKAVGKFKATGKGKPKPNGEQYKPKPNATGKNNATGKFKATGKGKGKGKQQP